MTEQPTDLDAGASGRITFLRSTTTTRVNRDASGDTAVTVEHVARFAAPEGVVPDQTHRFGSQTFAPLFITATWIDAKLREVRAVGPRRLKSGELAKHGDTNHDANSREQEYRGDMLLRDPDTGRHHSTWDVPMPNVILDRLEAHELAVATLTGGPR